MILLNDFISLILRTLSRNKTSAYFYSLIFALRRDLPRLFGNFSAAFVALQKQELPRFNAQVWLLPKAPKNETARQEQIPACCRCLFGKDFATFWLVVGKAKRKTILPHRQIIGGAIRNYRKQAHLTQEKLAERVDLNWKYIGEIERGEKIISIEALLRIAKVVEVPLSDFFRGI